VEFGHTLRELQRVRLARFAAVILGLTMIAALFAPWLAPYDPVKSKPWDSLQPPSSKYWLGADRLGRDQLSRLIYGARVSLVIGVGGVGIAVLLGMGIGVTAGWRGGMWDEVLMRLMDGLSAFPSLLLALALVAITGGTVINIICVVGLVGTPWVARVIRSQVLSLREREFIVAVMGLGARPWRIMWKHLMPNCLAPVIVQASLSIASAILLEAALSFLGVGVKPPTPTWGGMLRHAFETVAQAPWLTISPGLVIFLVVLACNFFGDALRDVLDPKLRGTRSPH
jgi:peptide/nickel transport system permease protein